MSSLENQWRLHKGGDLSGALKKGKDKWKEERGMFWA